MQKQRKQKGNWTMTNYFSLKEQSCRCCGEGQLNPRFLEKLNKARELAGIPFVLNCGYRCEKHNKEVGGSDTSSHLDGLAVDIRCTNSVNRYKIIKALLEADICRIGIGKDFVHCDDDVRSKIPNLIWLY